VVEIPNRPSELGGDVLTRLLGEEQLRVFSWLVGAGAAGPEAYSVSGVAGRRVVLGEKRTSSWFAA